MRWLALLILPLLAACGADGAPEAPAKAAKPGITVTGEASFGVVANGG